MVELLSNPVLIFWGSITLICVVPVIAHYWYKVRRAELEASLKRRMIEHGMSADEIAKVLSASADKDEDDEVSAEITFRGKDDLAASADRDDKARKGSN